MAGYHHGICLPCYHHDTACTDTARLVHTRLASLVPPECQQLLSILATIAFIQNMELILCAIRVAGDLLTVLHTTSSVCPPAQFSSSKCWASMETTCKRGGPVVQGMDPRLTRFLVFQCSGDRVQNLLYRVTECRTYCTDWNKPECKRRVTRCQRAYPTVM